MKHSSEFERIDRLYKAIAEDANDEGIFTGSKTNLYLGTRLSMKHYPRVWGLLEDMGCIEQISRGTSRAPTVIKVIRAPTVEDYERVSEITMHLPHNDNLDMIRRKVATIEERIPPIDLARTFKSIDDRLKVIEDHLGIGR